MTKINKLIGILIAGDILWLKALMLGVAANFEHRVILNQLSCKTIVDIGANRGQFSLVSRHCFPSAKIFSFEPLILPSALFNKVFFADNKVTLFNVAIGPEKKQCTMHVSGRDDSSSLLPISSLQDEIFPGTSEVNTTEVEVVPLNHLLAEDSICEPALLKLDVQGFEMDALQGCEDLLHKFKWIYCECSFVELYTDQKLATDVIKWLLARGFPIKGIYNSAYDGKGMAIQADFLFQRDESLQ